MSIPTDSDNPYAPPTAVVLEAAPDASARFIPEGRKVAAGRGFTWFGEAWQLFKRSPGTFVLAFVAFAVVWIVLALVPLGSLVESACYPVVAAGIMIGCRALDQGGKFEVRHLVAGFSGNAGTLFIVGLLYLAGVMVIGFLIGIGMAVAIPFFGPSFNTTKNLWALAPVFVLVFAVSLALMLPLIMALWFAPAIVAFNNVPAMAAMKSSYRGCVRNFVPFLAYGLLGIVLGVAAMIPVGLGMLVLGPVVWATMYTGYRDIFEPRD